MCRRWRRSIVVQLLLASSIASARGQYSAELRDQHFAYDEQLARLALIYSSAAYDRDPVVSNWTFVNPSCNEQTKGFLINQSYTGEGTEAFGYVGLDTIRNWIVVAFKGTSDLQDWMTDLRTWVRYHARCAPAGTNSSSSNHLAEGSMVEGLDGAAAAARAAAVMAGVPLGQDELIGNVHFGFCAYYQTLVAEGLADRAALLAEENPDYGVLVTGHSLGAAAAAVGAADLTQRLRIARERVVLYTFGEPRAGDGIFAEGLNDHVGTAYRVVHNRDLVPHLALCCHGWLGKCKAGISSCPYQHSTEIVYTNDMTPGSSWLVCNDTIGEDYACDPQDWDLSVTDHKHYFELCVGTHCATAPEDMLPFPEAQARDSVLWASYEADIRQNGLALRGGHNIRGSQRNVETRSSNPTFSADVRDDGVDVTASA